MTEQEKKARQVRIAQAMGIAVNGQDPDTDPAALLAAIEWFCKQQWFAGMEIDRSFDNRVEVTVWAIDGMVGRHRADTYAEAILAAIDAALTA